MNSSDKRTHARAQYFVLQPAGAATSVVQEGRITAGIPALVLDMSAGGLQIVADHKLALTHREYALELVTEADMPFAEGHIRLLWTKPDGDVVRNGFEFVSGYAPLAEIEAMIKNDPQRLLRCVLHPVDSLIAT